MRTASAKNYDLMLEVMPTERETDTSIVSYTPKLHCYKLQFMFLSELL